MNDFYICEKCVMSAPRLDVKTGRICNKYQKAVKDTDTCSSFAGDFWFCDCCGRQYPGVPPFLMMEENGDAYDMNMQVCSHCFQLKNTCQVCANSLHCAFQEDPSPIPQVINKEVRQGNMIMMTQVMNPERVKITCEKGCSCWHDGECARQTEGTCDKYKMHRS